VTQLWVYRLLRCAMGLIFVISGLAKLSEATLFSTVISAYGLLPAALVPIVARALPLVELIAGVCLMLDLKGSLTLISGMLLGFMGILIYGMLAGIDVGCACFGWGAASGMLKADHGATLMRDVVFLAVCGFLYYWRHVNSRAQTSSSQESSSSN